MNNWYLDFLHETLRREDEIHQAISVSDYGDASLPRELHLELYLRLLNWLGSRLVTWGCRLQTRYSILVSAPVIEEETVACAGPA